MPKTASQIYVFLMTVTFKLISLVHLTMLPKMAFLVIPYSYVLLNFPFLSVPEVMLNIFIVTFICPLTSRSVPQRQGLCLLLCPCVLERAHCVVATCDIFVE